jgi:Fic family protein
MLRALMSLFWLRSLQRLGQMPHLSEGDMFTACVLEPSETGERLRRDVDKIIQGLIEIYGYVTVAVVAVASGASGKTVRRHLAAVVESGALYSEGTGRPLRYAGQLRQLGIPRPCRQDDIYDRMRMNI